MKSLIPPFDAYKGDQPYIFVSYAHRNSEMVYEHLKKLKAAGYRLWYDEGIDPGTDWSDEIASALNGSACFLVFMSPESVDSHNVKKEIVFAVGKRKLMVSVYLCETELPLGLEMQLGNIQGILETAYISKDKFYAKLMSALPESTRGDHPDNSVTTLENAPSPTIKLINDMEIKDAILVRYYGSLKVLTIPNQIKVIGPQAFADCRSLESVILPDGVEKIDVTAFVNCVNLLTLFVSKTVTDIAYGAFTNCHKLIIKCWRDTPSHMQVKKVWSGPIVFFDDAIIRKPIVVNKVETNVTATEVTHINDLKAPANTSGFEPKGTAVITTKDGKVYNAIANTVTFLSKFNSYLGPMLYQGLDEEHHQKNYQLEDMIYFEDIKEFNVVLDENTREIIIDDYENEKHTKQLYDINEQLWFIDVDKPNDIQKIKLIDILNVRFDHRRAPLLSLPMALIKLNEKDDLVVPQAFVYFRLRDSSKSIPSEYWSNEIPLIENGSIALKRLKLIQITKVIREPKMYQNYTEVEVKILKKNGEEFVDKINSIIDMYVLSKKGIMYVKLTSVSEISYNTTEN